MDFMKVWDQAVREIKREVNLKVLKIPEIEQKVLDATSDEPWGPHGTALSEIAQATKKLLHIAETHLTECQLVMNVLWNRLMDTGPNWRHVYKALSVIEYLVANGSESALNDILEHSYQISSISGFEYVEPNGKDVGINVRKKVETILALLDDRERIQAARDKATSNREKYFGLSSTGITYKSSSASYGSCGFYGTYYDGASGSKETGSFKGSSPDRDRYGYPVSNYHKKDGENKSSSLSKENEGIKVKKGVSGRVRDQDSLPSIILKPSIKPTLTPKSSSTQPNSTEDDFDDFDPRGFSASASTSSNSNQVDLFAQSMIGDLVDASAAIPKETTCVRNVITPEVDLFAEATFISASPQSEAASASHSQGNVDFFACQSDFNNAVNQNIDFFAATNPDMFTENNESSKLETANIFDPFAAVPLNNSEESGLFGVFTAHSDPVSSENTQNPSTKVMDNSEQVSSPVSKPTPKKDTSQIKSAIWADSLSRGLIDLNITSPKKESPRAMGATGSFTNFGHQQEQFGTLKR